MIRGAIFDFDGTLFDSMYVWDTAGETFLRSMGCTPEPNLQSRLKAMSLYQSACYLRDAYSLPLTPEKIMEQVNHIIAHAYRQEIQPKPGVIPFLERLHRQRIKMVIATATHRPLVEAALSRCGMAGFFEHILTCTETGHGKDSPHIYRQALAALGTKREDTLVFEDALHALRTAHEDGFRTVAIYDDRELEQQALRAMAEVYLPAWDPWAMQAPFFTG